MADVPFPELSARSALQEDGVSRAALYIQDALDGVERLHPREGRVARMAHITQLALFYPKLLALLVLVGLGFLETPTWAVGMPEQELRQTVACSSAPSGRCDAYPMSGLPLCGRFCSFGIETACLVPLLFELSLRMAALGPHNFWSNARRVQRGYALCLVLAFVEALVTVALPFDSFRLAPYLRLSCLVCASEQTLLHLGALARTLPSIASLGFVLAAFLGLFAWLGLLIFKDTTEEEYFGTMEEALWSLLVLLTTANYPDVMMPAYAASRAAVAFFATFEIVGNWFLLNVVLAVVYKGHSDMLQATRDRRAAVRAHALRRAFELLDGAGRGALSQATVKAVFDELNLYREIAHIDTQQARLMFAVLDTSGDGVVDREEFAAICDTIQISFRKVHGKGLAARACPALAESRAARAVMRAVRTRWFDWLVDGLLLLNAVALVAEQATVDDADDPRELSWNGVELGFAAAYTVEMGCKMVSYGWWGYWRSYKNGFDALVTVVSLLVTAVVFVPNSINDPRLIRYVLALRLLRLLRLMGSVRQVRFISATFVGMLPAAAQVARLLFVLIYAFSALGTQLFGGLINRDPTRPQAALLGNSSFGASDYYANNFNDMASGFVVCFELLVLNNWTVLTGGFVAVTSQAARVFFVAFYVFGVLICLNLLVAFALDAFNAIADERKEAEAGGAPAAAENEVVFSAATVTGTSTGLSGEYRARLPQRRDARQLLGQQSPSAPASSPPPPHHALEQPPSAVSAGPR